MSDLRIYSSDLMSRCPRQRQLYREGKYEAIAYGALYRGLIAGQAIEDRLTDPEAPSDLVSLVHVAQDSVNQKLEEEGRVLSDAVRPKEIALEVIEMMGYFCARWDEWMIAQDIEIIKAELPVRWGRVMWEFNSHIDLLCRRRGTDDYIIIDWKWTKESPTAVYAKKHLQLRAYRTAVLCGEVCIDGFWTDLGAQTVECYIGWLPGLLPYRRRTTVGDVVYMKGDLRPMEKFMVPTMIDKELSDDDVVVHAQITQRASMLQEKYAPEIPTPEGCVACQSSAWCIDTTGDDE